MTTPDFENERQIESALAEAVKAHAPPAGLQEAIRERLFGDPGAAATIDPQQVAVLRVAEGSSVNLPGIVPFKSLRGR